VKLVDGVEVATPVADLAPGDLVRVKPGGRLPVDGEVIDGASEIDRALLTGRKPAGLRRPGRGGQRRRGQSDRSADGSGQRRRRDTALRRIADLVALAETARTATQLADRAAAIYAPGVHLLALAAFVGWFWATGETRLSINIAIAVLIITCPCALGLAVPAVTTAASGRLFRAGSADQVGTALERLAEIDTVVFDKTGTLTEGRPELDALGRSPGPRAGVALALARARPTRWPRRWRAPRRRAGSRPRRSTGLSRCRATASRAGSRGAVRLGRAAWVGAAPADARPTFLQIGDAPAQRFRFTDALRPARRTRSRR
jgi:Cu2+-exporting ATPase